MSSGSRTLLGLAGHALVAPLAAPIVCLYLAFNLWGRDAVAGPLMVLTANLAFELVSQRVPAHARRIGFLRVALNSVAALYLADQEARHVEYNAGVLLHSVLSVLMPRMPTKERPPANAWWLLALANIALLCGDATRVDAALVAGLLSQLGVAVAVYHLSLFEAARFDGWQLALVVQCTLFVAALQYGAVRFRQRGGGSAAPSSSKPGVRFGPDADGSSGSSNGGRKAPLDLDLPPSAMALVAGMEARGGKGGNTGSMHARQVSVHLPTGPWKPSTEWLAAVQLASASLLISRTHV